MLGVRRAIRRSILVAAILLGALAASVATASADTVNWDAIAQCESGGNWSTDTGNGFYGGLQFKQSTWNSHGGVGSPANASREQQIAVAERVLATQGIGAWPRCGAQGGSPAIWAVSDQTTGCASVRPGAFLGVLDLRQVCSVFLGPLTAVTTG